MLLTLFLMWKLVPISSGKPCFQTPEVKPCETERDPQTEEKFIYGDLFLFCSSIEQQHLFFRISYSSIIQYPCSFRYPGSTNVKNNAMAANIAQEDQAIKKQKLDGGRSRRILNVNTRVLLHKSKPDPGCGTNVFASHKEQAAYISTAEMIKKFQSSTRDIELSQNKAASHESRTSMMQMRPRLKLTRPKEPEFQTAARVRAVRIKSSAELEEEMLAKIPKFRVYNPSIDT
ncbi:protein TPX2-like [Asparagus officinalis]|uniref:protein TPX2-like n=1 Tax=Asparagus officinalis TaxID=4686 RepID=UPI00098E1F95|nr:protein TPX2-like [Asparagus officinalis]